MVHRAAIVVLLLSCPSFALAQAAPAPPPRHESSAEFAFVGVSGNASTKTVGLGYETIARPGTWVFRHRISFIRNESAGVKTAQSFLYTPRAEKRINTRLSAFGEFAYFNDRFAGIADRNTVNGGLMVAIINTDRQKLSADGGVGYLREDRVASEDISTAAYTAGTTYALKLSGTADLTDSFGLVGAFDHGDDWRLAHTIALTAKVTSVVSLKVANAVRYSNFPTPGFKRTDTVTSIALVASFKSQ